MAELPKKLDILKDYPTWITLDNVIGFAFEIENRPELTAEIVRRYNAHDDLLAVIRNALLTIRIMSMPVLGNPASVATNDELLKIMGSSFEQAIAKAEKKD